MSVRITVSWKIVDYPEFDFMAQVGDLPTVEEPSEDLMAEDAGPAEFVELGSSIIAPGLSIRVA